MSVAIQAAHTPNLQAVARKLAGGVAQVQQQYLDYAQSCVQPGIDYLNTQLSSNFLSAFKAARLFSAQNNAVMQPDSGVIDSLSAFPFFDSPVIFHMWVRILDVLIGGSCIALYSHTGQLLPASIVQPSSAASERAFSLLNSSFSQQQQHALQDYVQTSLMLQYNNR